MSISISLFLLLFITIIQSENVKDKSIDSVNGICSCDLKKDYCDKSCCCDADCSIENLKTFGCDLKIDQEKDLKSTVQSTCFKAIPIYRSNSPHVIQIQDRQICVKHEKNTNQHDLLNEKLNSTKLSARSLNIDNSVAFPYGTPLNLTQYYKAGDSLFRIVSTPNIIASYLSFPTKIFNNQMCSGLQSITYLTDFTSICDQAVNEQTCNDGLNTNKYLTSFRLLQNPSYLVDTAGGITNCAVSGTASSWSGSACTNPLETLTMTIYYSDTSTITHCNIVLTSAITVGTTLRQTYNVRFVSVLRNGSSILTRSGNPGYIQGAPIFTGFYNGSSVILQNFIIPISTTGSCTGTTRSAIYFGQNIQSTCLLTSTNTQNCTNLISMHNLFTALNTANIYVASRGNSDQNNINDWLPVTYCTSEIGSSTQPECQSGSLPTTTANRCYNRLDIQILYADFGSVVNPQPILGGIVFHYQGITSTTTPLVLTQTVTFQDVSNLPVTQSDHVSRPNLRVPGDFFYAFVLNGATNSFSFSSFLYLFLIFVFQRV